MAIATVKTFIDTYGEREAVDLTNIDDAEVRSLDAEKLQNALNDAKAQLEAFTLSEHPLFARWQMTTARYLLDVHLRRTEVAQDYETAMKAAQSATQSVRWRPGRSSQSSARRVGSRTLPPRSSEW